MKTKIVLFLYLLLLPLSLHAQTRWSPENLPMVHLKDSRRYVCNPDGVLSQQATASTDSLLMELEKDTGIETVVVVVRHLEGDDPFQFAMDLGRKYKMGEKEKNNGLIVVLAIGDRSYGIYPGSGLEGTLTDIQCDQILRKVMVPHLKKAEWDTAIVQTMRALDGTIRKDPEWTRLANENEESINIVAAIAVLAFTILFAIFFGFFSGQKKCPKCGKRALVAKSKKQYSHKGILYTRTHWHCKKCGHTETTDRQNPDDNDIAGGVIGGALLSSILRGGHHGGGGFSGGSFGGGSFGGGGASGRF